MAKILLIDDSSSIRMMCKFTLEQAGHVVKVAENGLVGLSSALDDLFDLVITDINMPLMDGYRVCAELRKSPRYAKRPILVLSSARRAEPARTQQLGVSGWIQKPFKPEDLIETVNDLSKAV